MSESFMAAYTVFNFFLQGIIAVFFILQNHPPRFKSYIFSMLLFPFTQFVYRTISNMIPGIPAWVSIAFGFFGMVLPGLVSCKFRSFADLFKTSLIVYISFLIGSIFGTSIAGAITGINLISVNNYNNYNDIYVVATPMCALIILICFETVLFFRMLRKHQITQIYLILFSVTVYQLILLAFYFQSVTDRGLISALLGLVITLFTMLLDYLIHRYANSIIENEAAAKSLREHKAKYEAEYLLVQETEQQINTIRSHRHDYMNQLDIIQHMIAAGTPQKEISAFIDQIIESIKG